MYLKTLILKFTILIFVFLDHILGYYLEMCVVYPHELIVVFQAILLLLLIDDNFSVFILNFREIILYFKIMLNMSYFYRPAYIIYNSIA